MTRYAKRLICFILLIFQFSNFNFAQTSPDATPRLPQPKPGQQMPTECESKTGDYRFLLGFGLDYLEKNLALCRAADNKVAVSSILRAISFIHTSQRRPAEAFKVLQESLAISESVDDKAGMISAMLGIGQLYSNQRNFVSGLEYLQKALALSEKLGDKRLIASSLLFLGNSYQTQNNLVQAEIYYERELKLHEELNDKEAVATVMFRMGVTGLLKGGDLSKSQEYIQKSLKLHNELGIRAPSNLSFVAQIYRSQGYYDQALEFYNRSLKLNEEFKNKYLIFNDLSSIAGLYQTQGKSSQAIEYHQRALKVAEELQKEVQSNPSGDLSFLARPNDPRSINFVNKDRLAGRIASILGNLGRIYSETDNYALATEYLQSFL